MSAKERPDLHFSMVDPKTMSPVGYRYYNKSTGAEIERRKTAKAFKTRNGKMVLMTEADFHRANPKATEAIDIEGFVELDEIDPVYFRQAYYLLPQQGGAKGYRLLAQALRKKKKVGVAKIVLHTRQHLAAIVPRGNYLLLELLNFAEDVKDLYELDSWKNAVSGATLAPKEMEMAERLIEDMTIPWKPDKFIDTYRADLMKRVQSKLRSGKATELTHEEPSRAATQRSNVVDLMPLLRKSLERSVHRQSKRRKA